VKNGEKTRRFEEGSGAKGKSENKRTKYIEEKSGFRATVTNLHP